MDSSVSALVGFGDGGKGKRSRTSCLREEVLHLINISCMAFPFEMTSEVGIPTPSHLAETEALQPRQGSSTLFL